MKLAIAGINGRMGQALRQAITARAGVSLVADGATLPADLFAADAVIDFTAPDYSLELAREAARQGKIHIIGTTGFSDTQLQEIEACAEKARIVLSYNMSIGVNIVRALVEQAAKLFDAGYDIEIEEMHHKHKKDAPSGTALMLASAAAEGRGLAEDALVMYGQGQIGERQDGTIGIAVRRGGNVVGEHTVTFAGEDEIIDIKHRSFSRAIYANGALKAALWVKDQQPGLYRMKDVVGV